MFKSVFGKYVTAATAIILASFLILASVITSIIAKDSAEQKRRDVEHIASLGADIVVYGYSMGAYDGLSGYFEHNDDIEYAVRRLTRDHSDVHFFVCDMNGRMLLESEGVSAASVLSDSAFFNEVLEAVRTSGSYSATRAVDALGAYEHFISVKAISDENGKPLGMIFALASGAATERLVGATARAIILACLWIMIAILIALYFITERIVGPLKRMGSAAQSYAKGRFDHRIEVIGHDEVAELSTAFNAMASELDRLEEKRNQFLSDVSHELRSPMMAILGFVEGIQSGAIPMEKRDYYLSLTVSEIKRLSRLVSDLLDVSRLEMGERKLNFVRTNLVETVWTVMVSLESRIEEKHLEVLFDEERENMSVLADPDALHRMIYNLIENAVKFSYEGGALRVSIREEKSGEILLRIYNEGIGIPKEDIAFVFDRFYKSDKSRSSDKLGVGLGLYFVKTILAAHGGSITAESEEGKYCAFNVTFPPCKD